MGKFFQFQKGELGLFHVNFWGHHPSAHKEDPVQVGNIAYMFVKWKLEDLH
jgi:hypothetical protein